MSRVPAACISAGAEALGGPRNPTSSRFGVLPENHAFCCVPERSWNSVWFKSNSLWFSGVGSTHQVRLGFTRMSVHTARLFCSAGSLLLLLFGWFW